MSVDQSAIRKALLACGIAALVLFTAWSAWLGDFVPICSLAVAVLCYAVAPALERRIGTTGGATHNPRLTPFRDAVWSVVAFFALVAVFSYLRDLLH